MKKIGFALFGIVILGGNSAYAQTPVRVTNPLLDVRDSQVDNRIQELNNNLNQTRQALIDALRGHSTQQTANLQQQTQADAAMRETEDNRRVQGRIEEARYNAQLAASGGATGCNIITGVVGSTALFNTANSARAQLVNLAGDFQYGESPQASVRNGTRAAIEERISATCRDFGTQSMVDEGICQSVGSLQRDVAGNAISQALNANTLFGTSVLNQNSQRAALAFIANAFTPNPIGPIARSQAATEEGREVVAARMTAMARNSVAVDAFSNSVGMRVPLGDAASGGDSGTATVRRWAEGTAARLLGGRSDGQNYPNGVSLLAWMELRARSFYLDPNFQLRVNSQDANANSKDSVLIQGFQTFLQWETWKLQEQNNVLLAQILSIMSEEAQARRIGAAR
jgi:hypothetical protein